MAGSWNGTQFNGDDTNDDATGTQANEALWGNRGDDVLRGEGGNDFIDGGVDNDQLFGGDGNDILVDVGSIPFGFSGIIGRDNLYGGGGDDELRFQSPDTGDFGYGGAGRDLLRLRFDWFNGNPLPAGTPITFTLTAGGSGVVKINNVNAVAVDGIEYVYMWGWNGNDVLRGGNDTDYLSGQQGDDWLYGQGGDDTIDGGTGIQHLFGGAGFDLASFDTSLTAAAMSIENKARLNLGAAGEVHDFEAFDFVRTGAGDDIFLITQTRSITIESTGGNDNITVGDGGSDIDAGTGDDTVRTGAGNDEVDGGDGNNVVRLGDGYDEYSHRTTRSYTGNERIWGEGGDDRLYTAAGLDITYGGAGNDLIYNGQGNDTSNGGDGNDTIYGETGEDSLYGGLGNDIIDSDYDPWLDRVTQETDRVWGEEGNDSLTGGIGRDFLFGGVGDDVVTTGLYGESSILDGQVDSLYGGRGTDRLWVYGPSGGQSDVVEVKFGTIIRVLVNGVVQAVGREFEAMTINAYGTGDQQLTGGSGNDQFNTGSGDDTVKSGGGNDTVNPSTGSDTLILGDGNDLTSFVYLDGTDVVEGGAGDDDIAVSGSFLSQGVALGGGVLSGGAGTDTLRVYGSDRGLQIIGDQIWVGGVHAADFTGFERVFLNGYSGGETLTGTAGDDTLFGGFGNDTLDGAGGNDSIDGGGNDDSISGGTGSDTIIAGGGSDKIFAGLGDDQVNLTVDTLADEVHGGGGRDALQLSFLANAVVMTGSLAAGGTLSHGGVTLLSYDGIESISMFTGIGDDSLLGGNGADTITASTGANTVASGGGDDQVSISADASTDQIDLGAGSGDLFSAFNAGVAGDMSFTVGAVAQLMAGTTVLANVTGAERVALYGNTGNDTFTGGALSDSLFGGIGRDDYFGGGDDDAFTMSSDNQRDDVFGGLGNDALTVYGGSTALITDLSTPGRVLIKSGAATLVDARSVELLRLFGSTEGDELRGLSGADLLSGNQGDDTIGGGGDADTLQGGAGADILTGGAGGDTFVYIGTGDGGDTVTDFTAADRIQVNRFGFVGLVAGGPVVLVAGTDPAASGSGGQFLFDTDDGRLLWDADGGGAGAAVLITTLENSGAAASLTADQFLVF